MIRLLLIDALNLIRRVYAAQPGDDGPDRAREGLVASAQSLRRAVREAGPTHALAVFEGAGPTWRHELFSDYKHGHAPMPEALHAALPDFRLAFAEHGVGSFELARTEADDVMATLAVKVAAAGGTVSVVSTDKNFSQLLGWQRITQRDHFRKVDLDRHHVIQRFGVPPEAFVDYLALAGDSGNGIRGVPGVGAKTAARLLIDFDTLDSLLGAVADGSPESTSLSPGLFEKLHRHREDAQLARELVRLKTDLELGLNLQDLRLPSPQS